MRETRRKMSIRDQEKQGIAFREVRVSRLLLISMTYPYFLIKIGTYSASAKLRVSSV